MHKNKIGVAVLLALFSSSSFAASKVNFSRDLDITGGVSGSVDFVSMAGLGNNSLATHIDDFIIDLESKEKDSGMKLGLGAIPGKLVSSTAQTYQGAVVPSVIYGWIDFKYNDIDLKVGRLATKVGYESAISYENDHITNGEVWNTQPTFYPGVRASKKLASGSEVYVDIANYSNGGPKQLTVFGIDGKSGDMDYRLNYYSEEGRNTIIDAVVDMEISKRRFGINANFVTNTAALPGTDPNALGLAVFTSAKGSEMNIPIRVEITSAGTSGLYQGGKTMTTFTATPTKKLSKNAYFRTEVAFANAETKMFTAKNGTAASTQISAAVQVGVLF